MAQNWKDMSLEEAIALREKLYGGIGRNPAGERLREREGDTQYPGVGAGARGYMNMASLGLAPIAGGAIETVKRKISGEEPTLQDQGFFSNVAKDIDIERQLYQQSMQEHPGAALIGQILGMAGKRSGPQVLERSIEGALPKAAQSSFLGRSLTSGLAGTGAVQTQLPLETTPEERLQSAAFTMPFGLLGGFAKPGTVPARVAAARTEGAVEGLPWSIGESFKAAKAEKGKIAQEALGAAEGSALSRIKGFPQSIGAGTARETGKEFGQASGKFRGALSKDFEKNVNSLKLKYAKTPIDTEPLKNEILMELKDKQMISPEGKVLPLSTLPKGPVKSYVTNLVDTLNKLEAKPASQKEISTGILDEIGDPIKRFEEVKGEPITLGRVNLLKENFKKSAKLSKGMRDPYEVDYGRLADTFDEHVVNKIKEVGDPQDVLKMKESIALYKEAAPIKERLIKATHKKVPSEVAKNVSKVSGEHLSKLTTLFPKSKKAVAGSVANDIASKVESPTQLTKVMDDYGRDELKNIFGEAKYKELESIEMSLNSLKKLKLPDNKVGAKLVPMLSKFAKAFGEASGTVVQRHRVLEREKEKKK